MKTEDIRKMGQAYLQVLEGNKFLIPEEIPTQERTAFHGAAAAAAKAGKSHFDFKGKKYPATMKKDTAHAITSDTQKEAADLDAKNVGKMVKHDCATHVEHAEFGKGVCIPGEHTLVETSEGEGYVTHYDVLFDHGIEKDVMVEDLKVTKSEAHIHAGKKLVKKEKNTTETEVQTQEALVKEGEMPAALKKALDKKKGEKNDDDNDDDMEDDEDEDEEENGKKKKKEPVEEAATAQHKPDEKTRDTFEKQLSTRKGEKDFVDQHKSEVPVTADEPKIDAMNFKTFRSMTKKSPARSADQTKGDTQIVKGGTPVKGQ